MNTIEPDETRPCPLCGGVLHMFYCTVENNDGDYLGSLIAYRHKDANPRTDCTYEKFEDPDDDQT